MTAKENFLIHNTLSCVPRLLHGEGVLIDLRNETSVAGIIENADGFMNIHLVDAVFIDRHGLQYCFDEFMVKNRFIRNIQIPESIDIEMKLKNSLEKPKADRRGKKSEKRTFKQKRAIMRNAETLKEIAEQNKEAEK